MSEKDLCDFCGGELETKRIDYEFRVKKEMIMIHAVKAEVCGQCGQSYIDAQTEEKIEEIYQTRNQIKPLRYIPVPVFSFGAEKPIKSRVKNSR